jgi:tRNA A37 threonylcarbamoyladenosine synthetase subunit TsaC/SUA5/YrdC
VSPVEHHIAKADPGVSHETVYGLGSAPTVLRWNVSRLSRADRPASRSFSWFRAATMAESSGLVFTPSAMRSRSVLAGPLTLVLRGGEGKLPDKLRGPRGFCGALTPPTSGRPPHRSARQPLTSTSQTGRAGARRRSGANRLRVRDAYDAAFSGSGRRHLGNVPPSTIVDCTSPNRRHPGRRAAGAELRRAVGRLAP